MDLKEEIAQRAFELDLDLIGFARARALEDIRIHLDKRVAENRHTSLEWGNVEERVNPQSLFPWVRTVISVGISYLNPDPKAGEGARGTLSRSAWGEDYHRVLGEKLLQLAKYIVAKSGARVEAFVDTGPPVDRAWALEGGLGWSGKNCALINPRFGSWVFLGSIYTDLDFTPDTPLDDGCADCELCLSACPTGALQGAHIIDPYRCISYLTQMKGFVPRQYRRLMGAKIYGCDTCQVVCPVNKQAVYSQVSNFSPNPEVALPRLIELLQMTNRRFKEHFGTSAAAWRGRTVLQRNALIALGNLKQKDTGAAITECLADQRPLIRGHAAWALGEMGEGVRAMEKALATEQEPKVREELELALAKIKGS